MEKEYKFSEPGDLNGEYSWTIKQRNSDLYRRHTFFMKQI